MSIGNPTICYLMFMKINVLSRITTDDKIVLFKTYVFCCKSHIHLVWSLNADN